MKKIVLGMVVMAGVILMAGVATVWAQSPTNLTVIRKADNTIWKKTCSGTSSCSDWVKISGKFAVQPTLTWDQSIQKYILIGIGNDKVSIWRSTFDADGEWEGPWVNITGTSGGSPSPVAISGGRLQPQTITVACPGQSLQAAIDAAQTGATINVTGTCEENVIIREEKARITIDGGNAATISGDLSSPTVIISGSKGITIRNLTITGGIPAVWVFRGANAYIQNNNIHNSGNAGIGIGQSSSACIKSNNIHDNPSNGIEVYDGSSARIGYCTGGDSTPSPNMIQDNGGSGISVYTASQARIVGNTITHNTYHGINVYRVSQADIASNTINANGGDGIHVSSNSSVQLGEDNPTTFLQQPNSTTENNTGFGIYCGFGATVAGHLGSENQINGGAGQTSITSTCPNNLVAP